MKKETIKYKGFTIKVSYDEYYNETPNDWSFDENFLIYNHRQFFVEVKGFDPEEIFEHIQETKKYFYEGYYVFPVYAYIHSGVSLSLGRSSYPFTDSWDTSFSGFYLVKRMKGTYSKNQAFKIAQNMIKVWNEILGGEVYGYVTEETEDGCTGFIGEEGYKQMIEEAKEEIDYYIKKQIKKHCDKLKVQIKNKVPIAKREVLTLSN